MGSDQGEIWRQHTLSRVLLRRFAGTNSNGAIAVEVQDLRSGRASLKSVRSVGFVDRFIAHEPEAAEALWRQTEEGAAAAFDALTGGCLFFSPVHVASLKSLVALHFLRRERTLTTFLANADVRISARMDAYDSDVNKRAYAERLRFGRTATPEEQADTRGFIRSTLENGRSQMFQEILTEQWSRHFADLQGRSLRVGAADGGEFLLGDAGPIAVGPDRKLSDQPLFGLAPIFLPIGPRHVASLSFEGEGPFTVSLADVDNLNRLSIENSDSRVIYRPGAALGDFVRSVRPTPT